MEPKIKEFYKHSQQDLVRIPVLLVELIKKSNFIDKAGREFKITTAFYDHAAMLIYVYRQLEIDRQPERGIPINHSDWSKALLLKESWAKEAISRLVKTGLLQFRAGTDIGIRTNRYWVSPEVRNILDGANIIDVTPGTYVRPPAQQAPQSQEAPPESPFS